MSSSYTALPAEGTAPGDEGKSAAADRPIARPRIPLPPTPSRPPAFEVESKDPSDLQQDAAGGGGGGFGESQGSEMKSGAKKPLADADGVDAEEEEEAKEVYREFLFGGNAKAKWQEARDRGEKLPLDGFPDNSIRTARFVFSLAWFAARLGSTRAADWRRLRKLWTESRAVVDCRPSKFFFRGKRCSQIPATVLPHASSSL
jgi:hypothetical protein